MKKDKLITKIMEDEHRYYFIHYSCQSLNDSNSELSPRVTSIVLLHLSSKQMITFSTHDIAEELKIPRNKIEDNFDVIETKLLTRFFSFVETKGKDSAWIHWNMKNSIFGFEHLEHRYRVLTQEEPYKIDIDKRYNLPSMISHKYGSNYADNPKMLNLMELNGGRHRDFLTGEEEVTEFKAGNYVKMLKSTMCKVNFFNIVLKKMQKNKLCTKGKNFRYKVNQFFQNPIVQIIGFVSVLITIITGVKAIIQQFI